MQGMVREVREIRHIAAQRDATEWQVVLAWLHQLPGVATSAWTHDRVQMVDNLAARRLSLDRADLEGIDRIGRHWSCSPQLHLVT
jgi:diketogulonate reductase-like aldo/keto reductase